MENARRIGSVEYSLYKRERAVAKKQLIERFPKGGLFIYKEGKDVIRICCTAKLTCYDADTIVRDIRKIKLPETDGPFRYLWFGHSNLASDVVEGIASALYTLNGVGCDFPGIWRFEKDTGSNNAPYVLLINDPGKAEFAISSDYSVGKGRVFFNICFKGDGDDFISYPDSEPEDIYDQIAKWLSTFNFKEFEKEIESQVLGQPGLKMLLLNVYLYLKSLVNSEGTNKHSVILAGPSGCGKTETYRALKAYFMKAIPKLVVSIVDINQITPEGFIGKNTNFILADLKAAHSNGAGIVFLDEFDKKLIPEHTSHGDNVNENIQSQLLMAIEGHTLDGIDTSKTMFIGMGSFDAVRKGRKAEKHIGFMANNTDKEAVHYESISIEDMVGLGAMHELIGRFVSVINYGRLSAEAVDKIIDIRLAEISREIGYRVYISENMRSFLHSNANTAFGNRRIYSLIRESVNSALIDILEDGHAGTILEINGKDSFSVRNEM